MAGRVDLDRLERLAKAATPGLWLPGDGGRVPSDVVSAPNAIRDGFDEEDYAHYGGALVGESMCPADREYVAAADPATVLALVAELRAGRRFRDDIHGALQPGRWRGWDGPDGVDVLEVIEDIAQALERHDQATGQPDPAAGHADPEVPP